MTGIMKWLFGFSSMYSKNHFEPSFGRDKMSTKVFPDILQKTTEFISTDTLKDLFVWLCFYSLFVCFNNSNIC